MIVWVLKLVVLQLRATNS